MSQSAPVRERGLTAPLLVTLALLSAVAPFATDLYLPAFPQMTTDLDTSATTVQLTLTGFLVGLAVGQLGFGPISDRFGRRTPLLAGAVLCVVASVVTVLAPTVEVLVAGRVLQGFAGAAGVVIGRAVISDVTSGSEAARAFSLLMIVGGVAPVVAPVVGGFLAAPLGWRGVLGIVLALTVLMLVAVLAVVRETYPPERRTAGRATGSLRDLGSRVFVGRTLTFAFGFTVMMAYISASPFVYQTMMGVSEAAYGVLFAVNALAIMASSATSARLVGRVPAARLLTIGVAVVATGAVGVLVLAVSGLPAGWLAVALFVVTAGMGLVLGNATGLALQAVPRAAGTASAVLGALQFGLAAVATPLVSLAGEDTAVPLGVVMVVAVAVAGLGLLVAGSGRSERVGVLVADEA